MCGIAGVVSPDPTARDDSTLGSMLGAIEHRGPDERGMAHAGCAALGAQRLAIIDVLEGHQPMVNETGDVLAVQNGEIYNFLELRAELERHGHRFRTRNDTEVLPHAYEEWGDEFVSRLRGMFAIAIWDERLQRLLLARDRFGKKPLVYASIPGGIVFASEIQALRRHPLVRPAIDESAIATYLSLGYIPAPLSAFQEIRKLPPAHILVFEAGSIEVRRYWQLRAYPKFVISLPEAMEELRARIDESVRLRLISDVPLGVFLSGGLDSSTVVAFMSRHLSRVRTFSVGFADARLNELPHARAVARAFNTEHEEIMIDDQDLDVLPDLIRHVGEPYADSSIIPTYQVARATRPHVTVALTGDGGDELFLGYDRYRAALVADAARFPGDRPVRGAIALVGSMLPTGHAAPRRLARAGRFLAGLGSAGPERYLQWSGYFTGSLWDRVVGSGLRRHSTLAGQLAAAAYDARISSEAERYAMADIELGLPGDLLTKMDIATMAASLEARSPLLDHELAEFVARLPAHHKIGIGSSKVILRAAMTGILPPQILRRGKSGFVAPVGHWLRGPLRERFEEIVPAGEAARRGWIDPRGVRSAFRDHMAGRRDHTRHLWSLLVLETWARDVLHTGPGRVP